MGDFTNKELLAKFKKLTDRFWLKNDLWYDVLKGIPYRKKVTMDYTLWTGLGGASGVVEAFELPAGAEILSCFFDVTTAFAGGGGAGEELAMSPTGTTDDLIIGAAATAPGLIRTIGTDLTTDRAVYSMTAGTSVEVELDTVGGALATVSQGVVDVYITYVQHND